MMVDVLRFEVPRVRREVVLKLGTDGKQIDVQRLQDAEDGDE